MPSSLSSKDAPILIVGAGVFGLSTAIHLAERGYTNVTIADKQPYHESQYSYDKGCDAASADVNKILRAAYGSRIEYQTLALDAITRWKQWNDEIASGETLPSGFSKDDTLFIQNGYLTLTSDATLPQYERDAIQNMTKAGLARTQVDLSKPSDVHRATADGFGFAINPFKRKDNFGLLDTHGGFVYADRACRFALHKAESLGVKTVFGRTKGKFATFLRDADGRVTGVRMANGNSHAAELTIMACGGWTPSLIPQLDNVCETTAGSVCLFQLPASSALWDKFASRNFPTWTYDMRSGKNGGLYGFARDANGVVKIGYRGTKYTNPQTQADGAARSVPITRWTQESTQKLPIASARVIRSFVQEHMPDLLSCEMKSRLCWYTDTFDNHFIIDFVPGTKGLMVATGGSGHGFKFLPILGDHVVDRIERKQTPYLQLWEWRSWNGVEETYNSIMEGVQSERSLLHQELTSDDSLLKHDSRL